MTTMGELNFTRLFDSELFVCLQALLEQVHHSDSLVETDDHVEARGMESHTVGLILELLIDFQIETILSHVRPHFNGAIDGARRDERLLDASVHAVDLAGVEGKHEVRVVDLVSGSLHVDRHLHDLLVVSREDERVFG